MYTSCAVSHPSGGQDPTFLPAARVTVFPQLQLITHLFLSQET